MAVPQGYGPGPKQKNYLSAILKIVGGGFAYMSFRLTYDNGAITLINFFLFVCAIVLFMLGIKYEK